MLLAFYAPLYFDALQRVWGHGGLVVRVFYLRQDFSTKVMIVAIFFRLQTQNSGKSRMVSATQLPSGVAVRRRRGLLQVVRVQLSLAMS